MGLFGGDLVKKIFNGELFDGSLIEEVLEGDLFDGSLISENTLDNLYYTIPAETSTIDFIDDLTNTLEYIESLDTKDVFKFASAPFVPEVISPIPQDIVTKYNLDTNYYKKYTDVGGIPILTTSNVFDEDIIANAKLVNGLLEGHDDIRQKLIETNLRIVLVDTQSKALAQQDFDAIPDEADGGTAVYNGKHIISYADSAEDRGGNINVTAHELIHAMDLGGFRRLSQTYPTYTTELQTLYDAAQLDANNNPNSKWLKDNGSKHYGLMRNTISDGEFVTQIVAAFYGAEDSLASTPEEFRQNFPNEYAFVEKYYGAKPNLEIPPFNSSI